MMTSRLWEECRFHANFFASQRHSVDIREVDLRFDKSPAGLKEGGLRVYRRNGSLVRTFSRLEAVSLIRAKSTSHLIRARSARMDEDFASLGEMALSCELFRVWKPFI